MAAVFARGQSNHSLCRESRYCAASRGFQSAAETGSSDRAKQTAARANIWTLVYRSLVPDTLGGVKQDASYFADKEPVLIYIGKKLKDSLRLEDIFAAANVDYGVEADEYRGGVIFRSVRAGAFFYVLPENVEAAHEIMRQNGYKPYLGA